VIVSIRAIRAIGAIAMTIQEWLAFDEALKSSGIDTIFSLLNGAWFGIPESTVDSLDLLEDPSEQEE
jgi:hypothetical protein